jgi:uncharacterized protein (DUF924 family)
MSKSLNSEVIHGTSLCFKDASALTESTITDYNVPSTLPSEAYEVVEFWRKAGPDLWFAKNPAFDRLFHERFLALHEMVARGNLSDWQQFPYGALALLILLDQFPRNAFRGTARMYLTDALARAVAVPAVVAGQDCAVEADLRVFFYLPFAHSESLEDQERSVTLVSRLGEPDISHAVHHHDIIRRFGRFPHRNLILGRAMTEAEQQYLDGGGYAG